MTRKRDRKPPFEPGCVPAPGASLGWRDSQHYNPWQMRPCALCEQPIPLRSHSGEPAHKVCAEFRISEHPTEARLGRFASDVQPKRRRDDHHA